MRKLIVSTLMLLTACSSPLYDYTLSWQGDRIHADLIYNTEKDTVVLYYGDVSYGGQRDIYGCVRDLGSKNFQLYADSAKLKTTAIRKSRGPLAISYDIACTLPDEGLNCPMEMFRPNITKDFIYINGINLFMRDSEESYQEESATVRWSSLPDFPIFPTYDPYRNFDCFDSDLGNLIGSVIVGDRELRIDTIGNNFIVTAPRSNVEYNRKSIQDYFEKFYGGIAKFWEEDSLPTYSLVIYPFEKIPFETSGIGLSHAFCSRYNKRSDTILTSARIDLFSHEIGHNWISSDWQDQWFGEGFNEYQTMYMIAATGVKPVESYVEYLNNSLLKLHRSSIRNMPNDSIAVHFWELGDYSWIPYWRGNVYAFRLMGQIGTEHPFKDLMMAYQKSYKENTRERFMDAAGKFIDSTMLKNEFDRFIIRAETMTLDSSHLPSGLGLTNLEDGAQQVYITDTAAFRAHFVL